MEQLAGLNKSHHVEIGDTLGKKKEKYHVHIIRFASQYLVEGCGRTEIRRQPWWKYAFIRKIVIFFLPLLSFFLFFFSPLPLSSLSFNYFTGRPNTENFSNEGTPLCTDVLISAVMDMIGSFL